MQAALRDRLLAAVSGTKVHWVIVPQGAGLPYVRLQTISDPRPANLDGYDSARETRVQADCFAANYTAARELADAVIAATAEPATIGNIRFGRVKAEGPRDLGEDTDKGFIFRMSVDLLICHSLA